MSSSRRISSPYHSTSESARSAAGRVGVGVVDVLLMGTTSSVPTGGHPQHAGAGSGAGGVLDVVRTLPLYTILGGTATVYGER